MSCLPSERNWSEPPKSAAEVRALATLEAELSRRLTANPLRLLRHPRLGVIPLRPFRKQLEFFERFYRVRKIMGWVGPNRPGKSVAAAMLCVEAATDRKSTHLNSSH